MAARMLLVACMAAACTAQEVDEFESQGPPAPDAVAASADAVDDRVMVRFCTS